MSFLNDIKADLDRVFFALKDGFSVPAVYNQNGIKKPMGVIVKPSVMLELNDGQIVQNATLITLTDALNIKPARGDTIITNPNSPLELKVYTVGEVVTNNGFTVDVYVRNA